jgi:hypothetical protein
MGQRNWQVLRARPAGVPAAPRGLRPTPLPSDRSDPAITAHSRRVGWPSGPAAEAGFTARSKRATVQYRCGMVLGKNKRTPPRGVWGDVRTAQVIGLPGVQNAPCCSVSASAHEDRVLTQTRGAEPYRGMLRVGARCCSCWEHRPGGRTFSADPALACRRSLPTGLLRNSAHRKGTCSRATPMGDPQFPLGSLKDMHEYPPRCDNESIVK